MGWWNYQLRNHINNQYYEDKVSFTAAAAVAAAAAAVADSMLMLQLLLLLLLVPLLLIVHNCARNCVHKARFNEHKTTFPSGAHSRTHRAMNFFSVCRLLVGRMRADEVRT